MRDKRKLIVVLVIILGCLFIYKFIDKEGLTRVIYKSLGNKEAALLSGMLLGEVEGFDSGFWDELRKSGLVHLVVVSGTNLMLIFKNLVEKLAIFIGRKVSILITLLITLLYINMVGWQIPVVRAWILISIIYWAQLLGRKYNIFRALLLSGLIIILAWPGSLKEVSFWLSFMAFIGVVSSPWKDNLRSSFWISLWISPILALFFGNINLISPISNMLILLIVEVVTIIGFLGSIIGVIMPILGKGVLLIIWPLLRYFSLLVGIIGSWEWVNLKVNFNFLILLGWYLILIWWWIKMKERSENGKK